MSKALEIKKGVIKSRATRQASRATRQASTGKRPVRENATDLTKYRRSTFYLKPETHGALKILAIRQGIELTVLAREILEKYVSQQRDS